MTTNEKMNALQALNEKQIELQAVLAESDTHALKCVKMSKAYIEEYPEEFEKYRTAREQYNINEQEIARIEAIIPEDENADA